MAKYQIPFKQDGNHADYAYQWEVLEWRDNYEFTETMQIIEYGRGNSSATFKLCDSLGRVYNCFMSDTFDIIRDERFAKGYITATFTFVKKGQSYGVKLVEPQIPTITHELVADWAGLECAPLEYFHEQACDNFHEIRKDMLAIVINGAEMNEIIRKAKASTYLKYGNYLSKKAIPKSEL